MKTIRCPHDGLKMAEIRNGYLILSDEHNSERHVKVVALANLLKAEPASVKLGVKG